MKRLVPLLPCRKRRHYKLLLSSGFGRLQAAVAVRVMYSAPADVTGLCVGIRARSAPLERTSTEQTQALLLIQVSSVLSKTGTLLPR